jgi:hypothetical protein
MSQKSHRKQMHTKREKARAMKNTELKLGTASSDEFEDGSQVYSHVKKSVYSISRIRIDKKGNGQIIPMGSGFLAGEKRLLTCEHVINPEEFRHQDGDIYVLIQKDENDNWHRHRITPKLNETLFLYAEKDLAIIYLPDDFGIVDGQILKPGAQSLKLSKLIPPIGTPVGVLGYPLMDIKVIDDDIDMSAIIIRGDRGIVNTAYAAGDTAFYEFTMAFNPGNSGGPIFDLKTGAVVAIVKSYNSIPLKYIKEEVPSHQQAELGVSAIYSSIRALYSAGVGSVSMTFAESDHGIPFV